MWVWKSPMHERVNIYPKTSMLKFKHNIIPDNMIVSWFLLYIRWFLTWRCDHVKFNRSWKKSGLTAVWSRFRQMPWRDLITVFTLRAKLTILYRNQEVFGCQQGIVLKTLLYYWWGGGRGSRSCLCFDWPPYWLKVKYRYLLWIKQYQTGIFILSKQCYHYPHTIRVNSWFLSGKELRVRSQISGSDRLKKLIRPDKSQ